MSPLKVQAMALCLLAAAALPALQGAGDRGAYHVRFGIVEKDKSGNFFLSSETNRLPLKFRDTGFRFGYEIVPPDPGTYTYQFVIRTPSPPASITGGLADANPGNPSTTVTSETEKSPGGTTVDYLWFDPGDPVGDWSIDVFADGKLQRTIPFTVSKP